MLFYMGMFCLFILDKHISPTQEVDMTIVSPSDIYEGGSFTVTCDASRAGVPTDSTAITQLFIMWSSNGEEPLTMYATYRTFIYPFDKSFPPDTTPARNWIFHFSENFQQPTYRFNNRNTMKIEMAVYDTECTDRGYYFCRASYLDENDFEISTNKKQKIDIKTNIVDLRWVTINPQYQGRYGANESVNPAGSYVSLSCAVAGPEQLNINWKFGSHISKVESFTSYDKIYGYKFGRTYSSNNCIQYLRFSSVFFRTEDEFDGYTYVCGATIDKQEMLLGGITIHTNRTIVNPSVIEEGKNFTVTCDATLAGVPTNATTIVSLKIEWTNGQSEPITYAEYKRFPQPYDFSFSPTTRNWNFKFSGGVENTTERPNNMNSMRIKIIIDDAECSDAGWYVCTATYYDSNDEEDSTYQNQSIFSSPRAVPLSLTVDPQYEEGLGPFESVNPAGSYVTLTCNVIGPNDLHIAWQFSNNSEYVVILEQSLEKQAVSNAEPVQISSETTCVLYRHSSTLKFKTEVKYDGYIYVCVARANNEDTLIGNMTIRIKQGIVTTTSAPFVDSNDIVSPGVLVEGGAFTVRCDASRAGVPENVTTISGLFIDWAAGMSQPSITYARYRIFVPPFNTSNIPKASPPREWNIIFNGSLQGTSESPKNRDTMKIQILIKEAIPSDYGVYSCAASYLDINNNEDKVKKYQSVSNRTTIEPLNAATYEINVMYYILPVVALVIIAVVVLAFCFGKAHRRRTIERRREPMALPDINRVPMSPPMDSNGYLLPVDSNGGYAQISDIATDEASANYYSSINDLEFVKESAESDDQSENTSRYKQNQESEVENLSELDVNTDKQHDIKTVGGLDMNKQNDTEQSSDYTTLYDAPGDVYSPEVNKYLAPNFESFI